MSRPTLRAEERELLWGELGGRSINSDGGAPGALLGDVVALGGHCAAPGSGNSGDLFSASIPA